MDTASQIVRAKSAELFAGEIDLTPFTAWLDTLPFPATITEDFKPFIRLVIGARCRLILWDEGAPAHAVIASLHRMLLELDDVARDLGPDPLHAQKRRYLGKISPRIVRIPIELW
jgi:hypothetical protein